MILRACRLPSSSNAFLAMRRLLGAVAHRCHLALDRSLAGADLRLLRPGALELGELALEVRQPALGLEVAARSSHDLAQQLGLEAREVVVPLLLVDLGDEVGGEVDDLLELLGLQLLRASVP